jgi:hypothetical protein
MTRPLCTVLLVCAVCFALVVAIAIRNELAWARECHHPVAPENK